MTEHSPNPLDRLFNDQQRQLVNWLGPLVLVADHSWPNQTTAVLELDTAEGRVIVKASVGDLMDHHIAREIRAHREVVGELGDGFPEMLHSSLETRLLVTRCLPGVIAEGTVWEHDTGVYRAAGTLLSRLHATGESVSDSYLLSAIEKTGGLLDRGQDLLFPQTWAAAAALLAGMSPHPVRLVPTHGDFQPRNWLVDPDHGDTDGVPSTTLIDFGRFDNRPWYSDLVRLHHQIFIDRPELAEALFVGAGWSSPYPVPPEDRTGWTIENLLQSVATVVWATGVGDSDFADEGRRMLDRTLADAPLSANG